MDRDDADEALVRAAREGGGDDELAAHLHALRADLTAPATPQARWNHLAAIRRTAAGDTAELPIDATDALPVATEPRRRRGNRAVVLVAAATVGILGLTGGLAAAGRLPRPAQDRVADFAEVVGVDLPKHEDSSTGVDRPDRARTTPDSTGSAPVVGPRGPGATGTLPGGSGSAPGHSPTDPDSSERAPGHTKDPVADTPPTAPGSSGSAPGQTGGTPGNSGNAPGHNRDDGDSGTSPGNSGNAPGHDGGTGNGNSGNAPGHTKKVTAGSTVTTVAPGNSGNAPGHQKVTAGSSPVQGPDQ